MRAKKDKRSDAIEEAAWRLIADPRFLFNVATKISELGVVGEDRNRRILFLAGVGRTLAEPPSVMTKGSTSSGKSTLVRKTLGIFSPRCILERAGLSSKALAYGRGSFKGKVLFITEYRSGKDALLLLRLLQSEGKISHESTTVRGSKRKTTTASRSGTPTVLTTTTDDKVFADDETRFLSVWVDESPKQTLAILKAKAGGLRPTVPGDLATWQRATSLLTARMHDFKRPPVWLQYVAEQLPLGEVKTRREWERCLGFFKAVALCRRCPDPDQVLDITFPDYCVAHRILEPALAGTMSDLSSQHRSLNASVAELNKQLKRSVTVDEIAEELGWKRTLVYKHVRSAVKERVLVYESGTREKNQKRLLAKNGTPGFLPSPWKVFHHNPDLGSHARYVDPFTGKRKIMRRKG